MPLRGLKYLFGLAALVGSAVAGMTYQFDFGTYLGVWALLLFHAADMDAQKPP